MLDKIKREIQTITEKIHWIERTDRFDDFDVRGLELRLEELRGQLEAMKI